MARKSKQTNGIDSDLAKAYIDRIEHLHGDLESRRGSYMAECKIVRDDIKEVYADAKDDGIPTKSLKAEVKTRELQRKIEGVKTGLDIDELAAFEQLQEALEPYKGLPLVDSAIKAGAKKAGVGGKKLNPPVDKVRERTDAELAGSPEEAADRVMEQIGAGVDDGPVDGEAVEGATAH